MGPKFVIVQGLKKEVLNGPKRETFHLVINCLLKLLIKKMQITLPLPKAQEEKRKGNKYFLTIYPHKQISYLLSKVCFECPY
jgi:hypothetical protein